MKHTKRRLNDFHTLGLPEGALRGGRGAERGPRGAERTARVARTLKSFLLYISLVIRKNPDSP